jgi:5-(carboxyamino)imidazole ribonucleotide synthase
VKIGVLGGGQLGRMLALAGYPLGHEFVFLEPTPEALAGIGEHIVASADDEKALADLAGRVAVVTYEFENVPVDAARLVERTVPVHPPPAALEASQDRLVEKRFFQELGIRTAPFAAVQDRPSLDAAAHALGFPFILKTRRMGYDGKGQAVVHGEAELDAAWSRLGDGPCIAEGFVRFARELSIIGVRGRNAGLAFYPLVENHHAGGILRRSVAPAPDVSPQLQQDAELLATRVLEKLEYVGVLAIELFQVGDALAATEMAPRVHNSGHWTIEGSETSQFENHVRAVVGAPLGSTRMRGHVAMVNLIGDLPDLTAVLGVRGAHLHLYGKASRPERKVGHVTIRSDDAEAVARRAKRIEGWLPTR